MNQEFLTDPAIAALRAGRFRDDPTGTLAGFSDHAAFCRESLVVQSEAKELVAMELGPGQLKLREAIAKARAAQRPARIIYLKSRRIQATTGTAAEFFHATAFRAGVHTVVLAHDAVSTDNIFAIYERFFRSYKAFRGKIGLPPARPLSDRIYFEHGDDPESSFIQVHTAGSTNFGRSFRIDNVHFSEYPYYADPAAVRASIMSAVAKLPHTTAVIEGTAKTIGDDFQRLWQAAVNGENEWIPLFLGWHEHPSNRMPLWLPPDVFQQSLSRDEREIMARYRLDLEQMAWRRWTIANDFGGDSSTFRREHPANPEEAFAASSRLRFSLPHIERMPIVRQAMAGELGVEDSGTEKRIIFLPNEGGALKVFRMPERGRVYACGADPSGGADANEGEGEADPDWAVAHIFDRDSGEQCCVFRARVMPGEFGRYLFNLLRWYNNAQCCLEKTGAGIGSLEALLNAGYPAALIYHRPTTPDQDPVVRSDKIGWNTDAVSREQAISLLDEAIRNSAIFVHDPITQRELMTFVINARGKAEAQKGTHDDTVLALAFVVIVMARMPRPVPAKDASNLRPALSRYGRSVESDTRGELRRLR